MKKQKLLSDEKILNQIHVIRGQKVMIDSDLAVLYGVETKRLKEQVRRNADRFPEDFMFEMTDREFDNWRSQIATSKALRHRPFCFTEQGATMLACVLNSKLATQMNVRIIRLFTRMREVLTLHQDILKRLEELEKNAATHDEQIAHIFDAIRMLIQRDTLSVKTKEIGFNRQRG